MKRRGGEGFPWVPNMVCRGGGGGECPRDPNMISRGEGGIPLGSQHGNRSVQYHIYLRGGPNLKGDLNL
jgi:hypothetical protein